jgi:hypothetical protein
MKLKYVAIAVLLCQSLFSSAQHNPVKNNLRAPAFPLVTIDPNTSAWSYSDELYGDVVRHWTGKTFPLLGVIKVDGKAYRFLGKEEIELEPIARMGEDDHWKAPYTEKEPSAGWNTLAFDDANWKTGIAPFGTKDKESHAKTDWQEPKIWVRRIINLEKDLAGQSFIC